MSLLQGTNKSDFMQQTLLAWFRQAAVHNHPNTHWRTLKFGVTAKQRTGFTTNPLHATFRKHALWEFRTSLQENSDRCQISWHWVHPKVHSYRSMFPISPDCSKHLVLRETDHCAKPRVFGLPKCTEGEQAANFPWVLQGVIVFMIKNDFGVGS